MKYISTLFLLIACSVYVSGQASISYSLDPEYNQYRKDTLYAFSIEISDLPDSSQFVLIEVYDLGKSVRNASFEFNLTNQMLCRPGTSYVKTEQGDYTLHLGKYVREFFSSELHLFIKDKDKETVLSKIETISNW